MMKAQRIMAVTAAIGAFALGIHEGDCTATVFLAALLLPMLLQGNKKNALRRRNGKRAKKIYTYYINTRAEKCQYKNSGTGEYAIRRESLGGVQQTEAEI